MRAIASGQGHEGAVAIHQVGAVLWGGRLQPGEVVALPDDSHVHVFVAVGSARLGADTELATGDAARLTDAGAEELTAGADGAEMLVWATS